MSETEHAHIKVQLYLLLTNNKHWYNVAINIDTNKSNQLHNICALN